MQRLIVAVIVLQCIAGCGPKKNNAGDPVAGNESPATESTPATGTTSPGTMSSGTTSVRATGPAPVTYEPFMKGLPKAGMWKSDPVFFDENGDGILDLAAIPRLKVKDLGDGPRFWYGSRDGSWKQSSDGLDTGERSCGGGIDVADLNADGHMDLAVADHCQGVFVYFGDGKGKWDMVTRELYPTSVVADQNRERMYVGAEDIVAGDVNGDGYPDLIVAASDLGGINLYLGDGSGSNWTWTDSGLPRENWARRLELVDINGDGSLDVVSGYADGPRVWTNDGAGNFTSASEGLPSPIMRGIYTGLGVGDINHDELLDFAIANWVDGPEVYYQQPDGSWKKAPDVFPDMYGGAIGLDLGDLDGDGWLDIAVAGRLKKEGGYVRGVFALLNDKNGGFKYIPNSGLPTTGLMATDGVTIADIDQDGIADIAAGSGLIIESNEGKGPVIDERLLVWRGKGPAK